MNSCFFLNINTDGYIQKWASQVLLAVKNLPANAGGAGNVGSIPGGTATHFSILAWRIPWTEEPGGLHSIGSLITQK